MDEQFNVTFLVWKDHQNQVLTTRKMGYIPLAPLQLEFDGRRYVINKTVGSIESDKAFVVYLDEIA